MIVVSHRGPYRFEPAADGSYTAQRGAGGLATALGALVDGGRHDATWIAAALSPDDEAAARSGAIEADGLRLRLVTPDPAMHAMHYDVVSNGILWFWLHGMFDRVRRPRFDRYFRDAWDAYVSVNDLFADAAAEAAAPGDTVLVNDYQLALVAGRLRDLRPDVRVANFVHTPFCGAEEANLLPAYAAGTLFGALACVPAGFHSERWARAYRRSAHEVLGSGRPVESFAASLGPDVASLASIAADPATRAAAGALADTVGERLVVARSDRIEPSKNIVRGFLAFDRLLEARAGLRSRVVFVAMLYPSRRSLPEYLAYGNEVEQVVERVNERWSTRDWTPILLDERDDLPRSIAALQRYDVLLVNPIRDGLNLVAMEGPVVNQRDGLLCLSPEAGAYDVLHEAAIPVHPFDLDDAAGALDRALATPLDERAEIARRLRDLATTRSPSDWVADVAAHAVGGA